MTKVNQKSSMDWCPVQDVPLSFQERQLGYHEPELEEVDTDNGWMEQKRSRFGSNMSAVSDNFLKIFLYPFEMG